MIPQQKQVCCLVFKKAEISIFDLKEPRQNSIDALRDLALFTALDILCMALHILFSSSGPIKGTLFSFLIAVNSDDE